MTCVSEKHSFTLYFTVMRRFANHDGEYVQNIIIISAVIITNTTTPCNRFETLHRTYMQHYIQHSYLPKSVPNFMPVFGTQPLLLKLW